VLHEPASEFEVEGVSNMPAYLQRFLGERAAQSGFSYDVVQDVERGWVEYTTHGTAGGYGQFYERPYAWLED
jgi:hypothetical protein